LIFIAEAVHVDSGFGILGQSAWKHTRVWLAADGICNVAAAVFVIAHDALGTRGVAREQIDLKPTGPYDSACAVHLEPGVEIHAATILMNSKTHGVKVQLGLMGAREQGRFLSFFLAYVQDYLSVHTGLLT
jgi:hypothetical protein